MSMSMWADSLLNLRSWIEALGQVTETNVNLRETAAKIIAGDYTE